MVKIHDCAGGKTDTGTDGLCAVTALIFSAGLSSGLAARAGSDAAQLFCCLHNGCGRRLFSFGGSVLRSFYLGESGALAIGGLMTMAVLLSGEYFVFLLAGAAVVVDGACGLFAVYRV